MIPSMRYLVALVSLFFAVSQAKAYDPDCRDVHVFLARGNNEPFPGRQGKLVTAICSGLESCDYEDIQFYNPVESPYCDSVIEGARNGRDQIIAYNQKCPYSKLVVSGYSQGAQVVGDVLGGGGGVFFQDCVQTSNQGLDPNTRPGAMIVAALLFGDTRHTAGQSYNVLNGSNSNGLFPREGEQLAGLGKFASVLHAYCVNTDPICAGGDVVETHLNYFDIYSDTAAAWVHDQIAKVEPSVSTSAPGSTVAVSKTTASSKTAATSTTTATSTIGSASKTATVGNSTALTTASNERETLSDTATSTNAGTTTNTQTTESLVESTADTNQVSETSVAPQQSEVTGGAPHGAVPSAGMVLAFAAGMAVLG